MINKILVFICVMLLNQVSYAGSVFTDKNVKVDLVKRTASGQLLAARQSKDKVQQIACYTYSWGMSGCFAVDVNGVTGNCSIWMTDQSPIFSQQVAAISPTTYITFGWDANGQCTTLQVNNNSAFL